MLSTLQKLIIKNYKNSTNIVINEVYTFTNILFLKQQINIPLLEIINDSKNYHNIKQLLFTLLNISQNTKIIDAFIDLENNGFNNFGPYNSQNKNVKNLG